MPYIENLERNQKIKKVAAFIGIFAAVAIVLALVFWGVRKLQMTLWPQSVPAPAQVQKSGEEKQKEMLDAINRASQGGAKDSSAPPTDEQDKKQQEMQDAINETNSQTPPISQEESTRRAQDMLNEMNKANKK